MRLLRFGADALRGQFVLVEDAGTFCRSVDCGNGVGLENSLIGGQQAKGVYSSGGDNHAIGGISQNGSEKRDFARDLNA